MLRINYKEKVALSEVETCQREIESAVEHTKLEYQSNLLATKEFIAEKKETLYELKTTYPLKFEDIINTQVEIEAAEDGLKKLQELAEELGIS